VAALEPGQFTVSCFLNAEGKLSCCWYLLYGEIKSPAPFKISATSVIWADVFRPQAPLAPVDRKQKLNSFLQLSNGIVVAFAYSVVAPHWESGEENEHAITLWTLFEITKLGVNAFTIAKTSRSIYLTNLTKKRTTLSVSTSFTPYSMR